MRNVPHVRRGLVDAEKVAPLDPLSREIVDCFRGLYAVGKEARQRKGNRVSPEWRLE